MTPEQMSELKGIIELAAISVIILQAVMGILILTACRRIAKNEVELANLIREAVEKIEGDLPAK